MKRRVIIYSFVVLLIGGGILIGDHLLNSIGGFVNTNKELTATLNSEAMFIEIKIDQDAEFPHAMDLSMQGEINGTGILQYGWSDSVFYKTDTISQDFLLDYCGGDWYNDMVIIKYTPFTATEGLLEIDCTIYSSKKRKNDTYR